MKQKQVKQSEAQVRQEAYDSLSTEEKVKRARAARGFSRKQLKKLGAWTEEDETRWEVQDA